MTGLFVTMATVCSWLLVRVLLVVWVARATEQTARLRVDTHLTPGFSVLTETAKAKAKYTNWTNNVGSEGLAVPEADMGGFMSDLRSLIFNGSVALEGYPQIMFDGKANLWMHKYEYALYRRGKKKQFYESVKLHNAVITMLVGIILAGHLAWFFERHKNKEQFPTKYKDGIDDGLWWSAVTVTTVGYGDKFPVTILGRWAGFIWMFSGVILSSIFTAEVTESMLQAKISSKTSMTDFYGEKLCTTATYWKEIGPHNFDTQGRKTGANLQQCIDYLANGTVSAVYYDKPPLEIMFQKLKAEGRAANLLMSENLRPQPLELCPVFNDMAMTSRVDASLLGEFNSMALKLRDSGEGRSIVDKLYVAHFTSSGGDGDGDSEEYFWEGLYAIAAFIVLYTGSHMCAWLCACPKAKQARTRVEAKSGAAAAPTASEGSPSRSQPQSGAQHDGHALQSLTAELESLHRKVDSLSAALSARPLLPAPGAGEVVQPPPPPAQLSSSPRQRHGGTVVQYSADHSVTLTL
eukprot:g1650.t1